MLHQELGIKKISHHPAFQTLRKEIGLQTRSRRYPSQDEEHHTAPRKTAWKAKKIK